MLLLQKTSANAAFTLNPKAKYGIKNTNPHKMQEAVMPQKTFLRLGVKDNEKRTPTGIESNIGVSKAMPLKPKVLLTFTKNRVRLENFLPYFSR